MMGVRSGQLFFACALLIFAALVLLMPFFLRASYVFGRLIDGPGFFPGIDLSLLIELGRQSVTQKKTREPGQALEKSALSRVG
jgi:hypothetical protein